MISQTLFSPGKINLILNVTGRRSDGYHLIDSIFVPTPEICDQITLEQSEIMSIESLDPIPLNQHNLAWKAILKYIERVSLKGISIHPFWKIKIEKKIPIAAGMGGGSSDAGAVLRILQQIYQNPLSPEELNHVAVQLGADVPFFLNPVLPCQITGIGEQIVPLEDLPSIPPLAVVICAPGFPISAQWAYTNRKGDYSPSNQTDIAIQFLKKNEMNNFYSLIKNDLSHSIYYKFPFLQLLRDSFYANHAIKVEISGSGPTLFAIMDSIEIAHTTAKKLSKEFSGIQFIATSIPLCRVKKC